MIKLINNFNNKKVSNNNCYYNWDWNKKQKCKSGNKKYWICYKPDHPFAFKSGYYYEHRLIYEKYFKCILLSYVHIHHINGNGLDNRIENLQPIYNYQHISLEKFIDKSDRYCLLCGGKTLINKKDKREYWHTYKNGLICNKCYMKLWHKNKNNIY